MFLFKSYKKHFCIALAMFSLFAPPSFGESTARNLFNLGKKEFNSKNYFTASSYYRQALKINPYYLQAKISLADSYFMMKHYDKAYEIYLKAFDTDPDDPSLLLKLAKTKIANSSSKKDMIGAQFYLNKAYKLKPRDPEIISEYGKYYFLIENYSKAISFYDKLGSNVKNVNVLINKADVYLKWGQKEAALKALQKAELLDPNNDYVLLKLALFYKHEHLYDQSIEYLNSAKEINPHSLEILTVLAHTYMKNKQFENASKILSQLTVIDATNPLLYFYLSLVQEALGNYKQSILTLNEALQYDYGNEFIRFRAEQLAIKYLPLKSPIRKDMSHYYDDQIEHAIRTNNTYNSVFLLKKSLRIYPTNNKIRMKLAEIYRSRGLLYTFLKVLDGGLFVDPNNEKLKIQKTLNRKFISKTLEAKESVAPFPKTLRHPIFMIHYVGLDQANQYQQIRHDLQEELFNHLSNNHLFSVFLDSERDYNPKADFTINLFVKSNKVKTKITADIHYLKTGSLYKRYSFVEYGNRQLFKIFTQINEHLEKDFPLVGKIIKIQNNTAIINLGKKQNIKKNMKVLIIKDHNIFNSLAYTQNFKLPNPIATGKITHTGDNISKIVFTPLKSVVFNMVQLNESVIIKPASSLKK